MIDGRIVRLGNSAAIAISKRDLEDNKLEFNQKVKVSIIKNDKQKALQGMFGLMKGAKPFKREEKDRVF